MIFIFLKIWDTMYLVIKMNKKVLTIQDISCYGQCSITVALPILSACGIETAILPSAILSTHTGGFHNVVIHDLTEEMPKIISHWQQEGIRFDAICTGYIGNPKQFDFISEAKEKLLKTGGLWIVDPAMADNGRLYKALNSSIVSGMKRICKNADFILPNLTEACLLTDTPYLYEYSEQDIRSLLNKLSEATGCNHLILTGVERNHLIGAACYNDKRIEFIYREKLPKSYHGTGDTFTSIFTANILNGKEMVKSIENACDFVGECIKQTISDEEHKYGVHFERVLKDALKQYL